MANEPIKELWAYVATRPDGDEGILVLDDLMGPIPLISDDRKKLEVTRNFALREARARQAEVRLVCFSNATVVETFPPDSDRMLAFLRRLKVLTETDPKPQRVVAITEALLRNFDLGVIQEVADMPWPEGDSSKEFWLTTLRYKQRQFKDAQLEAAGRGASS